MVHKVYISIFVVSAVQTTDVRMAAAKEGQFKSRIQKLVSGLHSNWFWW